MCGDFNIDALNYSNIRAKQSTFWKTNDEYELFMSDLNELGKTTDVYYHHHKEHPITYGEVLNKDGDKVLTFPCDVGTCLSLDYIIEISPDPTLFGLKSEEVTTSEKVEDNSYEDFIKSNNRNFLSDKVKKKSEFIVNYSSSKVEKFLIKRKPYTQLSDHYGLSVELEYKN